jgi:hypothetical protein
MCLVPESKQVPVIYQIIMSTRSGSDYFRLIIRQIQSQIWILLKHFKYFSTVLKIATHGSSLYATLQFMNYFSGNCAASVQISIFMCLWAIYIFPGRDRSTYCPAAE